MDRPWAAVQEALKQCARIATWARSPQELIEDVDWVQALSCQLAALHLELLREIDAQGIPARQGAANTVAWVRDRYRLSAHTASQQVKLATALDTQLPETTAALADGSVNPEQAQVIAKAVATLPAQFQADGEKFLIGQCPQWGPKELGWLGERLLERIAPEVAEQRVAQQLARAEQRAYDDRRLHLTDIHGEARVRISGWLDRESAAIVRAALDPLCAPRPHANPDNTAPPVTEPADTGLRDATLRGAGRDAGLRDAGLRDAGLRDAGLRDAGLGDASPRDAGLGDATLRGADLGDAGLGDASPRDAGLGDATLRGADLGDAGLGEASPRDAGLGDATLRGADLGDAGLGEAGLRDTALRGADLGDAGLGEAGLRDTALRGADLRGADLRGAGLRDAEPGDAGLRGSGARTPDPRTLDPRTLDSRTPGQRRADALVDVCRLALACRELPDNGGDRPQVVVTVDIDHLREETGAATLDDGSVLSPAAARRLACDARILPAVLGGAGQVLDVGRERRLFTGPLRRALVLRDGGCAFPTCDRPARWCEGHHVRSWLDHGPTNLNNAVLLCGHHHRVIHQGQWQVQIATDGLPEFIPPPYIDAEQQPRRNTYHRRQ